MSKLIDNFINQSVDDPWPQCKFENDPKWYLAKPLHGSLSIRRIYNRVKDAYRVLKGSSMAVHFREDEINDINPDKGY